jgi:hypothetical protein
MMVSAANGAKLISNKLAPSPMAMYFMVIFPYPLSAPVSEAGGFIVIEATLKRCQVLPLVSPLQSVFQIQQNKGLG